MKYLFITILLFISTSGLIFSQESIEKLPGLAGGNFTSAIEYQDTLYTISHSSEVFTSSDNGATWRKDTRFNLGWSPAFEVEQSAHLQVDENRNQMYVYGSFGLMIYSSGSISIPEQLPEFFGSAGAFGQVVVSDSALYASYRYSVSSQGEIIKSTDGGVTWNTHDETGRFFTRLEATNDGKLLGANSNDLYLSEEGGVNFTDLSVPSEFQDVIIDILVTEDAFYYSTFELGIQSSTDEGANWTQVHTEPAFSLNTLSDGSLIAGGINGHVYISSDGGTTWSDTDLGYSSSPFNSHGITSILENDGIILATTMWGDIRNNDFELASAGIITSTDEGSTWAESNSGLEAVNITQVFYDQSNDDTYLFAIGLGVHKWESESSSWTAVGNPPDLSDLEELVNTPEGWGPVGGTVQLSRDTGTGQLVLVSTKITLTLNNDNNNWEYLEHEPFDFLNPQGLYFMANGTAIAHESLGPFQGLYTSTDLTAWTEIEVDFNVTNISQFSASENYLAYFDNYAFDEGVGTHYSSDMGESWTFIQENREGLFTPHGYFLDRQTDQILTAISSYPEPNYELTNVIEVYDLESSTSSEIIFSTDEELTQAMVMKPYRTQGGMLFALVYAQDENSQSVPVGYYYQSEQNWKSFGSNLPEGEADEISLVGENEVLFRFGSDIYSTTVNGVGTSTEDQIIEEPYGFRLFPNYPNPFNPTTQLQFELNQPSKTKVTVYTTLGQVVREMELGYRTAGRHQVSFDAFELSSGIYIYTIQANNDIRTGKMTLLK